LKVRSKKAKGGSARVQGPTPWFRRDWVWGSILILFAIFAYTSIWHAGFIWDDDVILTANPCIVGPLGLKEIWTTNAADICPLTITTFWLEHALWGLAPLPYHLVNIVLHGACAVLLWQVLRSLHVQGAWLGAALWALHPVEVESVAWITEMKNTESALFFLLSTLFFVKWLNFGRGPYRAYIFSLLFAALAMASKSSTVVLPVVLCLCLWWIEGRWDWRKVARIVPLFLMSVAASAVSIWTQGLKLATAPDPQWVRSWPQRFAAAGDAVWFYLGKLLWPDPLITIYPRWQIDAGQWVSYLPLLAVILLFSILWLNRRSGVAGLRACFFAFAYFVTALLPVLGLMDNSIFRYSLAFDHLQYLASIGPLALAGAALAWSWKERVGVSADGCIGVGPGISRDKLPARAEPALKGWRVSNKESLRDLRGLLCKFFLVPLAQIANQLRILASKNSWFRPAFCAGLLSLLGMATWQRTRVYESQDTLWSDTLAKNPNSWVGHNNLGFALIKKGQIEEAMAQYQKALEINPNYTDAHNNLGNALFRNGQLGEAMAQYEKSLEINPNQAAGHYDLGLVFYQKGQLAEAIAQYQKAIEINPNFAGARLNLGNALLQNGQLGEAIEQYQMAIKIDPRSPEAHGNLGVALMQKGQLDDAITQFQEALRLNPNLGYVQAGLAKALENKK
jgi:tetratricopeptide (TPR) repeat protein